MIRQDIQYINMNESSPGGQLKYFSTFRSPKWIVTTLFLMSVFVVYLTFVPASLPTIDNGIVGKNAAVDFRASSKNSIIRSGIVSEKCLNEKFFLTGRIRRCEKGLRSVRPGQFQPQQISLTYYGVEGEMGVSWVTFDGLVRDHYVRFCPLDPTTGVCLSHNSGKESVASPFTASSLRVESNCQIFLPFYDCRFLVLHSVNLTSLRAGHQYQYRIYSSSNVSSKPFRFVFPANFAATTTEASSSSGSSESSINLPQRFLVFSDIGIDEVGGITDSIVAEAGRHDYDMALSMGDYAYDLQTSKGGIQQADIFKQQMEPMASRIPFMTIPGNHERFPDPGGEFYQYLWRFRAPGQWPQERERNLSYSINVGKAHMVFLNSESLYGRRTPRRLPADVQWLERDLKRASAERRIRPWILVFGHVPTYCPYVEPSTSRWFCRGIRSQLENPISIAIEHLLYRFHVDVCFWGDFHMYERTFPMYHDQRIRDTDGDDVDDGRHVFRDPRAPVHVVNGVGGNHEGTDILMLEGGKNTPKNFKVADWSAFRSRDLGFGRLILHNSTHLNYEQLSVFDCPLIDASSRNDPCGLSWPKVKRKSKMGTPKVIDHFWIVKKEVR